MMQGKVQQFRLQICTRHWNSSYQDLLDILQLPSLENQRLFLSLSTFLKIIHNLIYFPANSHPTPISSSLRCSHDQFSSPFAHTNHLKYSFLPNSISLGTNLSLEAVNCTTLPMFKYYTLPLFLNVVVLPWVHYYISSWLFVYPLHLCINCYRKIKNVTKTTILFQGGMFQQQLESVNYQNPPWSLEYPELVHIFQDHPCIPVYNVVANNTYCGGTFIDISSDQAKEWLDTVANNSMKC